MYIGTLIIKKVLYKIEPDANNGEFIESINTMIILGR
jgi:hypothetical protein